jgi:hypothetical protein
MDPVTGALLGGGMDLLSGVVDQVGSGIREELEGQRKLEQIASQAYQDRKTLQLQSDLSKSEAKNLLELELKKLDAETKSYKDKSGVDIEKYKQLALLDQDKERIETDDQLKLINAKYGGESDLLKLKANILGQQQLQQQQYQPTRLTDYNVFPNMGAYGSLNSPYPQYNYSYSVPLKKPTPSYRVGLTGHKIEQV